MFYFCRRNKKITRIMESTIIQIGNQQGIILPNDILKKLKLKLQSLVNITIIDNNIVIKSTPRQGWAEAAKMAHLNGDDKLVNDDVFEK